MSLAVGHLHWIIPVVLLAICLLVKSLRKYLSVLLYLMAIFMGSLFMMHWKATPIWQAIKPLEFLQFPWRLLTLSIFTASFMAGLAALVFRGKKKALLLCILVTLLLALNANYFRPREWLPHINDATKFVGKDWQWQVTGGIFDYLPIWAPFPPADGQSDLVKFVKGSGAYQLHDYRTNFQHYTIEASESGTLEVQTYYFPGWKMWLDKSEVQIDPSRDPLLGRMQVDVSQRTHDLVLKFSDTPVRFASNALSLIAWTALIFYFIPWPKRLFTATYG